MSYRITRGDFQARFDPLGRLTHVGHPDHIKEVPTAFHTTGPFREGNWYVNCGSRDIFFDPEDAQRTYDFEAGTLKLESEFRDYCRMYGLNFQRTFRVEHGLLRCDFTLRNWSSSGTIGSAATVRRLRYSTGVNSWTDYSSDWAHRPYPTNLRCEQGFFWAAAISPAHDVIGYFSATPVDSWFVQYEAHGMQRIQSFCIDFVNSLDEHPDRWRLQHVRLDRQQPSYSGTFYVGRFDSLEAFWQKAADVLGVAFLAPKRCGGFVGETLKLDVIAPTQLSSPIRLQVRDEKTGANQSSAKVQDRRVHLPLTGRTGRRILTLDAGGRSTEARIWQHTNWAETLLAAARYAADVKRAGGYNAETVLGLITVSQAGALLDDKRCRTEARKIIEECYETAIDRATGRHKLMHDRLQNYGSFLDAIRIYHNCFQTTEYLDVAHRSARQLMSLQLADGSFYNHHNIYNNVVHPVKSLFDWGQHLREHGRIAEADEVTASVERAYRNIAASGDDTMTEGCDHFEDGMTACAGYQIAALWPHFGRRKQDLETAIAIYQRRRALKSRVPDSRFFGATLRHWEGYWAMGLGQCMLGGHGWNAWSASLAHALFMATGQWDYLLDAYATITNCLQSVDLDKGVFNFGFAVDPCWNDFYGLGSQHPGEQYVAVPDEVTVACESHSVFLTLDDSFYRQVYLRLGGEAPEVLNGRLLALSDKEIELDSYALELREIVVALEDLSVRVPAIAVKGRSPKLTVIPVRP